MLRKIARFIVKVCRVAVKSVRDFIIGCWTHAETIAVLTLASFGATALIGEIPFYFALPMWVEQGLIVPVAAVMIILTLLKLAEWRAKRRMIRAA